MIRIEDKSPKSDKRPISNHLPIVLIVLLKKKPKSGNTGIKIANKWRMVVIRIEKCSVKNNLPRFDCDEKKCEIQYASANNTIILKAEVLFICLPKNDIATLFEKTADRITEIFTSIIESQRIFFVTKKEFCFIFWIKSVTMSKTDENRSNAILSGSVESVFKGKNKIGVMKSINKKRNRIPVEIFSEYIYKCL